MDALRHKVEIITDAGKKKVVEENIATDDFSTVGEGSRKQKEEW